MKAGTLNSTKFGNIILFHFPFHILFMFRNYILSAVVFSKKCVFSIKKKAFQKG